MRLSASQRNALKLLASNGGERTMGKRPLEQKTVDVLADRGLVTTYQKTVIGVTITKVALTDAGREYAE